MAYRVLCFFLAGTAMYGTTLTLSLNVRENSAPSRNATLNIADGSSSVTLDLFRTANTETQVKQLGFCNTFGIGVSTCDFTPGGSITGVDLNIPATNSLLLLDGVTIPSSQFSDYTVSFAFDFSGGSQTHGTELAPWGPVALNAGYSVAITRISEGKCVFCAYVPSGTGAGSASGLSNSGDFGYSDYSFQYQASGEAAPEPAFGALVGVYLLALYVRTRK